MIRTVPALFSLLVAPALFEKGSAHYPHFSFGQDAQGIFIAIGENRMPIRPQ